MFKSYRVVLLSLAAALAVGLGLAAALWFTRDRPVQPPQPRAVQPGAPGHSGRVLSPQELARISAPPHTPADTLFFQRMIQHHMQAIQMAALVDERAASADLPVFAQRVLVSQQDE